MIDNHLHSTYSFDSISPPSAYVDAACQCGLKEIGFAEHLDLDPHLPEYNYLDYPAYRASIQSLQQDSPVPVRCGLEVSYQPHLTASIADYLSGIFCDFVIGSVHEVARQPMDHTFLQHTCPSLYFEAVQTMIASKLVDVVGHLEYFKQWGGAYTSSQFKRSICTVLQQIIENDMVLEVNTAGLRHPAQEVYPSFEVIFWYKELGGELISLGSDAHHVSHVGFSFLKTAKALKAQGFDTVCSFTNRRKTLVEL
jgi:histidinol-phosphatase (PHP family)